MIGTVVLHRHFEIRAHEARCEVTASTQVDCAGWMERCKHAVCAAFTQAYFLLGFLLVLSLVLKSDARTSVITQLHV